MLRPSARIARASVVGLVLLALAKPGGADTPAGPPSTQNFEQLLAHLDGEEKALQAEMTSGANELAIVRQRILVRGRA